MKKALLLHGMSGSLDRCFGVKLKQDLIERGYEIIEPMFTTHEDITYSSWVREMDKYLDQIDSDTVVICHSLGTNFIIKYTLAHDLHFPLVIAVAGGVVTREEDADPSLMYLADFCPTPAQMEQFRAHVDNMYDIYSDNDDIWSQSMIADYIRYTGAKGVLLPNKGHFGARSGVKDIPEIVSILDNIIK